MNIRNRFKYAASVCFWRLVRISVRFPAVSTCVVLTTASVLWIAGSDFSVRMAQGRTTAVDDAVAILLCLELLAATFSILILWGIDAMDRVFDGISATCRKICRIADARLEASRWGQVSEEGSETADAKQKSERTGI